MHAQLCEHLLHRALSDVIIGIQAHQDVVPFLFPFLQLVFEVSHKELPWAFKLILFSEVSELLLVRGSRF